VTVVAQSASPGTPPPATARRLVWAAFACFGLGAGLGFAWDRAWHTTRPFEDFLSPPHLFIYLCFGLTAGLLVRLASRPGPRAALGPSLALLPRPAPALPGAVWLALGGIGAIGLAGTFDAVWHTAFGLDETAWSLPHSLLGWGVLLTVLGLTACRLAIVGAPPARWTVSLLALVVMLTAAGVLLGPFNGNRTPATVGAIAAIPVLAEQPEFQHTARIYLDWNLTRTAALFVPLAALVSCAVLAYARALTPRTRVYLALTVLAWLVLLLTGRRSALYLGLAADASAWMPLPLLPALLVPALAGARLPGWALWGLTGGVAGATAVAVWGAAPALLLAGIPAGIAGGLLGTATGRLVTAPARVAVWTAFATVAAVPAATGMFDLVLRRLTP
jgi:hypothetical protein